VPDSLADLLGEARRQLDVCNACRYCEGYCAVFPALERRTILLDGDVAQLANLCHDCRACFQACMYAPPHEFGVDVPALLARARMESYERFAWPRPLGIAFRHPSLAVVGATAAGLKGRAGWLGYAATGVRRLAGARTHFEIRLDGGQPMGRQARCVVVGNVGLLPGGFVLLPEARPDDGLLDVGILAPAGLFGWPRVAWRVLSRSPRDDAVLERYQARRVEIAAEARLPRQADGELMGAAASLTVALAPGGLLVRVPAARPRRSRVSLRRDRT